MALTVQECRALLGALADGKSDAEVKRWRDELSGVANAMYDHLQQKLKGENDADCVPTDDLPGFRFADADERRRDALDSIRLRAYAHNHELGGESEDAG